ncbi:biopolymer transporter ExbD [Luteolibacter flavescens]|uniref:Biopolymer transporter ExbD n=1 Tax=Luteolibacter flavescens TaxID=1859460 RepID=A0ABT3FND2_9BACT|nr:biopolymer transporter ExbD [Luteolibacter flavescens]MCW1885077.1 biopolymer transporter ExbD [Luteolibacter flavescens]
MAHKKKKRKEPDSIHIGFQIAPMIDVVFVIMLFFMVMAGQQVVENELNLKLPGTMQTDEPITVEETQIQVTESGEVLLNEDPVGAPEDSALRELAANMLRLAEASNVSGNKVVVTIMADEFAPYQRVIDVLNALAVARIENVTFEVPPQ